MHKILVPTDFSKHSDAALEFAGSLAKKLNGQICLLHILEVPEISTTFPGTGEWSVNDADSASEVQLVTAMMDEASRNMKELRKSHLLEGLNIIDNIEMGEIEPVVKSAVSRFSADLIIIGAPGESNPLELFIGTQTEKIIRASEVPVLTIKTSSEKEINNIVFASDFSEEAISIFPKVLDFAAVFGARIHLLRVNTLENFETSRESHLQMTSFVEGFNLKDSEIVIYNDLLTESGIINYVNDNNADLIAIGSHSRKGFSHLFSSSIAEDLIKTVDCPVLTINIQKSS